MDLEQIVMNIFMVIGIIVCIVVTAVALVWLTCFVVRILIKTFGQKVSSYAEILVEDIKEKAKVKRELKERKREAKKEQKEELLRVKLASQKRMNDLKKKKLDEKLHEKEVKRSIKLFGSYEAPDSVFEENKESENVEAEEVKNESKIELKDEDSFKNESEVDEVTPYEDEAEKTNEMDTDEVVKEEPEEVFDDNEEVDLGETDNKINSKLKMIEEDDDTVTFDLPEPPVEEMNQVEFDQKFQEMSGVEIESDEKRASASDLKENDENFDIHQYLMEVNQTPVEDVEESNDTEDNTKGNKKKFKKKR